ncbi:MAG: ABC transporter substrate-binding protein [Acidimicrobiales bacterium]
MRTATPAPKRRRRSVRVAAGTLGLATIMAACGSTTASGSGGTSTTKAASKTPVTITLSGWTSSPVEAQLLTKDLAGFSAKYPYIHVKYRPISGSGSNYESVLRTRFVAGNAPDVIYVNNGGESSTFIHNNDLIPLNSYIKKTHFSLSGFYPSALAMFEKGGKVYGIPKDQSPLALFYNTALFKQAGITSPPTTWAQLSADAKLLTVPSKHQYGLINSVQEPRWAQFLYQAGGSVMNSSMTKMTMTSPGSVKGYTYFVNLYRHGYATVPTTVGASWGGQAFGMGKAGMVMSGNWLVPFLGQTYPKTPFGIAPLPKGPVNNLSLTFPVAYGITKDSAHPNAAWTLVSYLTSTSGMTRWMKLGLALPTRRSLVNLPYYKQHPVLQGLLAQLPNSVPWTFPPGFVQFVNTTMLNQTTLAIEGKQTPKQALSAMQKGGQSILASAG